MLNNINNIQAILKEGMLRTDVNPLDLIVFAARDEKVDGDYRAAVMQFSDLIDDLGGLTTVAVDGVTITGDGTVGNPLIAVAPTQSYTTLSGVFAQSGTSAPSILYTFENTLAVTPTLGYLSPGVYTLTDAAIQPDKTFLVIPERLVGYDVRIDTMSSPGTAIIRTVDNTGTPVNDVLNGPFELRIYN